MVDQVVERFTISLDGMREVSSRLTSEFVKGLAKEYEEGSDITVRMLITYVHSLPDGTENGDFLALDLGGSNFRVLLINLDKTKVSQIDKQMVIDDKTKQSTQEILFDFIAKSVSDFIKEQKITRKLPLGFTFSFPVAQSSLISGTLIRWTKDFSASGAEGKDVVQLLGEAFARQGSVDVDVVALVNDTTGTQLAVGIRDPECHIGLILGTGTNACYMEKLEAVPKFTGDRSRYSNVIINTEWGAFGDDGKLDSFLNEFDRELDTMVVNKGQQTLSYPAVISGGAEGEQYEKMISGKYVGELTRLAISSLIKDKILFGGKTSDRFSNFLEFDTKYVSMIEAGNIEEGKKVLKEFSIEASDADCEAVKRICAAVSTRAARLAASGIVALVKKIGKLDGCSVAVDGSLYKKHPHFAKKMSEAMEELAPGNKITMKLSEDGSGKGAAIVAAVACRLKAAGEYGGK